MKRCILALLLLAVPAFAQQSVPEIPKKGLWHLSFWQLASGLACIAIVSSLVGDIIMPIVGAITGGLDFSNYFTPLSKAVTAGNLADAKKQGAVLAWGSFLTLTLNFIIIAFVLFMVIRAMNTLKRKDEAAPAPPKPTREVELLTEIRDLLKRG